LRKAADRAAAKNNFTEDWLAVIIGVFVFALALFSLSSADLIGWAVTTSVYTDIANALAPVAKAPAGARRRRCAASDLCRASGAAGSFGCAQPQHSAQALAANDATIAAPRS
jgi:hypothetical protein